MQPVVTRILALVTQLHTGFNGNELNWWRRGPHTHAHTLSARTRGPVKYKLVLLMCHKMPLKVINWSVIGGWHVIYMKIICIRQQSTFPSKAFYRFYVETHTY